MSILLNHHCNYQSKSVYDCDKLLLDVFERKELKIDMKSILIHVYDERWQSNDDYSEHEDLDYIHKRLSETEEKKRFEELHEKILFLDDESESYEDLWWK